MNDEDFMRLAIEESRRGDWPYGAVLVRDGVEIARAHNTCRRDNDVTAHAEINLIRAVLRDTPDLSLADCTLYSSSESCPLCAAAQVWAGIGRVVYGASIEQLIEIGQHQIATPSAEIYRTGFVDIEHTGGVLAEHALAAFEPS